MGPYITEPGTPVAAMWEEQYGDRDKAVHMAAMLKLTTRMNALARITLGNVNIAATTALQAIDPLGRELALRRGANVLMPILTPTKYREHYTLYEGKPCINDTADECQKVSELPCCWLFTACFSMRLPGIPNNRGHSPPGSIDRFVSYAKGSDI